MAAGRRFYPVNTFSLVTLLCFLCHNGKGKAKIAIILIDSLAPVCCALGLAGCWFSWSMLSAQGSVNHKASLIALASFMRLCAEGALRPEQEQDMRSMM
jgi:hypothetical protein